MQKYFFIVVLLLACMIFLSQAHANDPPTEDDLKKIQEQMKQDPDNLDNYFAYAQVAVSLGKAEEAKKAYLHMLAVDPLLQRVKLDLGLLYLRTGQYEDAKHLFTEVLETKPPIEVETNIKRMLKEAEQARKKSRFNASVAMGYNYDTNANSSANSGHITINDISIPLDNTFRKKRDSQTYAAASVQHRYWLSKSKTDDKQHVKTYWNSRGTVYRADQAKLDEQNIQAFIMQVGPSFEVAPLHSIFSFNGGYQYITLDGRAYLKVKTAELSTIYSPKESIAYIATFGAEDRDFINSPRVSTYSDRSGNAYQAKLGINYKANKNNIYSATVLYRRENARQAYYSNDQFSVEGSYTRVLPHNMFINTLLSYRMSNYDEPDPLVSLITREEYEKSFGLTFGKILKNNITYTIGYQYRKVDSNLQNYEYANHRFSVGIGWNY